MSAATIIEQAEQDGVMLALSENGNVKATGDQGAISRWLETIRQHKQEIIVTLRGADLLEQAAVAANDDPEFDEEAPHFAWVFHFVGQEPETGVFMAPVNYRQALAMHPSAIAAVPLNVAVGASCQTCRYRSRPGGYPSPFLCGGRDDLPRAYGDGHPLRQLPEDNGADCHQLKGAS